MWLFILKFFIMIGIWCLAHKICMKFPFDFMEKGADELKPYDYYWFYSTVYMIVILIGCLMFA